MASVLPKIKMYFFISMICLLINMSVFFTTLIQNDAQPDNFLSEYSYQEGEQLYQNESEENTLSKFAGATGGSFIPFFGLVNLIFGNTELPSEVTVITTIIITIIVS